MNKYKVEMDRRWLLFLYILFTNMCFIIRNYTEEKLPWTINIVLWSILSLIELITIIKTWGDSKKYV